MKGCRILSASTDNAEGAVVLYSTLNKLTIIHSRESLGRLSRPAGGWFELLHVEDKHIGLTCLPLTYIGSSFFMVQSQLTSIPAIVLMITSVFDV